MKIALVRQRYVAHGGAERYLNAMVAELARLGHQVHVFANRWDAAAIASRNAILHRVPMLQPFSFLRVLSFAICAKRAVSRAACDVVISFERTLRQDLYRAGDGCHREWLAQRKRYLPRWKRATLWLNPLHATLLWLERQTFSPHNTHVIIANSERGKQEIVRHYGFPSARIQVVHNGVDCEQFSPDCKDKWRRPVRRRYGISLDDFVALFVGSGWERKGLEFAIRAVAQSPPRTVLLVVGTDRNAERYHRLAQRVGVAERVVFAGATDEVEKFYGTADVFLLPTIYEPFANVCLEAMACGVPVVTTRVNGASEIITDGSNGAVIEEPSDIQSIVKWLQWFREPSRAAEAGRRARQTATSLSMESAVKRTLEVCQEVLAARSGTRD